MSIYIYIWVYIYEYIYMSIYIYEYIYMSMYVYIYIFIYIMYLYLFIYSCIYIYKSLLHRAGNGRICITSILPDIQYYYCTVSFLLQWLCTNPAPSNMEEWLMSYIYVYCMYIYVCVCYRYKYIYIFKYLYIYIYSHETELETALSVVPITGWTTNKLCHIYIYVSLYILSLSVVSVTYTYANIYIYIWNKQIILFPVQINALRWQRRDVQVHVNPAIYICIIYIYLSIYIRKSSALLYHSCINGSNKSAAVGSFSHGGTSIPRPASFMSAYNIVYIYIYLSI